MNDCYVKSVTDDLENREDIIETLKRKIEELRVDNAWKVERGEGEDVIVNSCPERGSCFYYLKYVGVKGRGTE